jgi:lipid-A-disaccharide synthase
MSHHIFMLAGEASGDKLGGLVIEEMKNRGLVSRISGIGGEDMTAQGIESLFPMQELTVLGFAGAIRHYRSLKKRAEFLIDHIRETRPQLILTIDSKGFSLPLGKALKAMMAKEGWSVPVVHLVAPTVWAWGGWRAKSVPLSVDHLLCLFPFEIPYFKKYGTSVSAVGHPATDINWPSRVAARRSLALGRKDFVLGLFPGSRRREVENLLPDMCIASARLREQHPDLKIITPATASMRSLIEKLLTPGDGVEVVGEDARYDVMRAADYGLICSGTVTLEAALAGLAGSVYYRGDVLSSLFARFFVDLSKVVLPNAITGREIYPFYFNKSFNGDQMARQVSAFMASGAPVPENLGLELETALTPLNKTGKDTASFQQNVADKLGSILNDF